MIGIVPTKPIITPSSSLQQALLSQQTLSRFPLMNGMPGAMPWFPQPPAPRPHDIATATTNLPPFQVSEFIKHAAQQQLQAQLKVRFTILLQKFFD